MTGWRRCTGCAVCTPESLSPSAAAALLDLAAATVAAVSRGEKPPRLPELPDAAPRGVFVTVYHRGTLRGCIGQVEAEEPLPALVRRMAVAAAREDPRFAPVTASELPGIQVAVSLLTEPRPAEAAAVETGRHGVVIRRGHRQGVLLPQVAAECGWDAATLLTMACRKAGLAPGAWREPDATILVFEADVLRGAP